jgi:hypothetical protein
MVGATRIYDYVYNIEVEDFHTYYVGKAGILSHDLTSIATYKSCHIRTKAFSRLRQHHPIALFKTRVLKHITQTFNTLIRQAFITRRGCNFRHKWQV